MRTKAIKRIKPLPTYTELKKKYLELKQELEDKIDECNHWELTHNELCRDISKLEKKIKELKEKNKILERNIKKTLEAWNKDKKKYTEEKPDIKTWEGGEGEWDEPTPQLEEKKEDRNKYPWMEVGC